MFANMFLNKSKRLDNILNNLSEFQFFFNKGKRYVKGIFDTKLFKGLMPTHLYNNLKKYQKCFAIHNAPSSIEEGKKIENKYVFHDIYCFYNEDKYANSAIGLLDIEKTYNYDRAYFSFGFEGLDCQVITVENRYNQTEFKEHSAIVKNYYNKFFREHRANIYYYSTNYTYCYIASVQNDENICKVNLKVVDKYKTETYHIINVNLDTCEVDITPLESTVLKNESPYVAQYIAFLLFGK